MSVFEYSKLYFSESLDDSVASNTNGILYENGLYTSFIRFILLHNYESTTSTVSLYRVPAGSSVVGVTADIDRFWKGDIESNSTISIEIPTPGIILDTYKDSIKGKSSPDDSVSILIIQFHWP